MIQIEKITHEEKEPLYYVQVNDNLTFAFALTKKQLKELYLEICQHLFDNLLEQNKDLLIRLKNNEPAPKMVNSDKVIEWLDKNISLFWKYPVSINKIISIFKEDFLLE